MQRLTIYFSGILNIKIKKGHIDDIHKFLLRLNQAFIKVHQDQEESGYIYIYSEDNTDIRDNQMAELNKAMDIHVSRYEIKNLFACGPEG